MRIKSAMTAVVAAMALAVVPIAGTASADTGHAQAESYTDVEIAEGVLYGEGTFAEHAGIQPMSKTSAVSASDIQRVQNRLMQSARKHHPKEFAAAVNEIRTGDPYAVDEGIRSLSSAFGQAIKTDYPKVAKAKTVKPQCGVICVCVAGVEIAVVGGIAVAVVAETAIGGHFVLWTKSKVWNSAVEPQGETDLAYTDYVAKVASAVQ